MGSFEIETHPNSSHSTQIHQPIVGGAQTEKNRQGNKKAGHFEPSRPKFIRRTLPWAFRSVRVRTLRDAVEVTSSFWYVTQNQKNLKFETAKYFYLFLLESEEKFCTSCKKLCGFCTRHQLLHFCRATQRRSGRQFINWCVELGGNIVRLLFISVFMSAFITVVWSSVD